jgi:hypothetical protein
VFSACKESDGFSTKKSSYERWKLKNMKIEELKSMRDKQRKSLHVGRELQRKKIVKWELFYMVQLWVTHDGDLVGRLGLRGSSFAQVGGFPCVLACISFSHISFSPIMKELVSTRSDLGLVDVHGLGLYRI